MPDVSLIELAALFTEMVTESEVRTREGLEEAARIVQREAKAELGHYQEEAGPFPAWAELADATKDDRVRQGYTENDPGLRSGEMRDSIQHIVDGHEAHIGSDDEHLFFFELGTVKQPPRPVLAGSLIRREHDVAEAIGRRYLARLHADGVVDGALPVGQAVTHDLD